MNLQHIVLVIYAKTYGLFYLIAIFIGAVIYACWPSNKAKFDDAAKSIIDDEDKPCR